MYCTEYGVYENVSLLLCMVFFSFFFLVKIFILFSKPVAKTKYCASLLYEPNDSFDDRKICALPLPIPHRIEVRSAQHLCVVYSNSCVFILPCFGCYIFFPYSYGRRGKKLC